MNLEQRSKQLIFIKIIALIFIIVGVRNIYEIVSYSRSAAFWILFEGTGNISDLFHEMLVTILPNVFVIISGIGLFIARKWSFVLLFLLCFSSLVGLFIQISKNDFNNVLFVMPLTLCVVTLYCWSKREFFK